LADDPSTRIDGFQRARIGGDRNGNRRAEEAWGAVAPRWYFLARALDAPTSRGRLRIREDLRQGCHHVARTSTCPGAHADDQFLELRPHGAFQQLIEDGDGGLGAFQERTLLPTKRACRKCSTLGVMSLSRTRTRLSRSSGQCRGGLMRSWSQRFCSGAGCHVLAPRSCRSRLTQRLQNLRSVAKAEGVLPDRLSEAAVMNCGPGPVVEAVVAGSTPW